MLALLTLTVVRNSNIVRFVTIVALLTLSALLALLTLLRLALLPLLPFTSYRIETAMIHSVLYERSAEVKERICLTENERFSVTYGLRLKKTLSIESDFNLIQE
jgi:hypothetical protein